MLYELSRIKKHFVWTFSIFFMASFRYWIKIIFLGSFWNFIVKTLWFKFVNVDEHNFVFPFFRTLKWLPSIFIEAREWKCFFFLFFYFIFVQCFKIDLEMMSVTHQNLFFFLSFINLNIFSSLAQTGLLETESLWYHQNSKQSLTIYFVVLFLINSGYDQFEPSV